MDMDNRDRPHFRTSSTGCTTATTASANAPSELFICFTSRLSSSSSMKLTKSILSPGRAARDAGPVSLSSSLSRRLRTNGSLKGGQASPFFTTTTTTGKKRGCGFENPEPSSPKVTCIGQVRVKTKKKVKQQSRSLSRRRSGEVSFRKIEQGTNNSAEEDNNKQRHSNGGVQYQQPTQECLQAHRNQRWVHLPVSICEALRTFGAEFSCLFPCSKSSCFSTGERENGEKQGGSSAGNNENGCGAVFARWLVSVNDEEGGKRREIELVVGNADEEEERTERVSMRRSSRRHVFEDIEVKDDVIEVKGQSMDGEAAARVSISIPPKNALLLMRCRSDPMKMAALANRFSWDARAAPENHNDGYIEKVDENKENVGEQVEVVAEQDDASVPVPVPVLAEVYTEEDCVPDEQAEASLEVKAAGGEEQGSLEEDQTWEGLVIRSEEMAEENVREELQQEQQIVVEDDQDKKALAEEEEEVESNMSSFEDLLDQDSADEPYQDCPSIQDNDQVENVPVGHSSPSQEDIESNQVLSPPPPQEEEEDEDEEPAAAMENDNKATVEEDQTDTAEKDDSTSSVNSNEEDNRLKLHPETTDGGGEDQDTDEEAVALTTPPCEGEENEQATPQAEPETENPDNPELVTRDDEQVVLGKEKGTNPVLPECLLLMMCEPKLSMEVSKETWVCSTDFIRWLPDRPRKSSKLPQSGAVYDHDPTVKRRLSIDSKSKPMAENNINQQQQPRSSCSSMATMIEQKLVKAVGYEPFVLTRCKSEPMRSAAAKLMPESCCWKNSTRNLEPHRRAGAAGVGF